MIDDLIEDQGELALEIGKDARGQYVIERVARPIKGRFSKTELRDAYLDASRANLGSTPETKLLSSYYSRVVREHDIGEYAQYFQAPRGHSTVPVGSERSEASSKVNTFEKEQARMAARLKKIKRDNEYAPLAKVEKHDSQTCKNCILLKRVKQ